MKVEMNPMRDGHNVPATGAGGRAKKSGVSTKVLIITALLMAVVGLAVGWRIGVDQKISASGSGELDYSTLDEVYAALAKDFDGALDKQKLIDGAKKGMAEATDDQYTQFFTKSEADEFLNDLEGSFEGIGAELGQKDGKLVIVSTIDNSPARNAGLRAGDVIAKINGEESVSWSTEKAVDKIRGDAGTTVKLTIARGSSNNLKDYTITRAKITDPSVKWEIKNNVGYMRISRFGDTDTAMLAQKAAQEFKDKNVRGVILDLRGNGGGYVTAAQSVASLWLPDGKLIVQEKKGDKVVDTLKASGDPVLEGIKTVVLVDEGTASASEIVSGALRDGGAATLVGQKTYGKGVVQVIRQLSDGAQIKITTAKWYTPSGHNIDHEGITPDIKVTMTAAQYNSGNDTQKNKALELLNK